MPIEQEKGEVRLPFNDNEDRVTRWADPQSARVKKGTPGREGRRGGDWESKSMNNAVLYGSLPPGSDTSDQEMTDQRVQDITGPYGNGSQFTNDLTAEAVRLGYSPKEMSSTDEHRTNEHISTFYDEITVDGKTAYLERQNVLDRN